MIRYVTLSVQCESGFRLASINEIIIIIIIIIILENIYTEIKNK